MPSTLQKARRPRILRFAMHRLLLVSKEYPYEALSATSSPSAPARPAADPVASLRLTSTPTLSWPGVKKIRQRWQLGTRLGTWLGGRFVLDLRPLPAADHKAN